MISLELCQGNNYLLEHKLYANDNTTDQNTDCQTRIVASDVGTAEAVDRLICVHLLLVIDAPDINNCGVCYVKYGIVVIVTHIKVC
jgi:hypothetical protein